MMRDERSRANEDELPEDVASLYTWANMSASPYRDYSAARARTRELTERRLEEEKRKAAAEAAEAVRASQVVPPTVSSRRPAVVEDVVLWLRLPVFMMKLLWLSQCAARAGARKRMKR
jgi:hypothetical protein